MKVQRPKREETRSRILGQADELLRHRGYAKTTVAEIAAHLSMSPANVYKFFPSKGAIIEAVAERSIALMREQILAALHTPGGALDRLEAVMLTIHRFHEQMLIRDRRQIFELIMAASEENWACVRRHEEFLLSTIREIIEDGRATGEFSITDAASVAAKVLDCLLIVTHPNIHSPEEVLTEERVRKLVRFVGRALK